MNGKVTRSCIYKMSRVPDNAEITTIEGVGTISDMHPIQVAWMAYGCAQCGFCSPGFIISAKVLLDNNPSPTREEVRDWFNKQRNLCRCTGYKPLIEMCIRDRWRTDWDITNKLSMFARIIIGKAHDLIGISKKSGSHLPNLSGTEYNSFVDMFCHHFIAAFLSART